MADRFGDALTARGELRAALRRSVEAQLARAFPEDAQRDDARAELVAAIWRRRDEEVASIEAAIRWQTRSAVGSVRRREKAAAGEARARNDNRPPRGFRVEGTMLVLDPPHERAWVNMSPDDLDAIHRLVFDLVHSFGPDAEGVERSTPETMAWVQRVFVAAYGFQPHEAKWIDLGRALHRELQKAHARRPRLSTEQSALQMARWLKNSPHSIVPAIQHRPPTWIPEWLTLADLETLFEHSQLGAGGRSGRQTIARTVVAFLNAHRKRLGVRGRLSVSMLGVSNSRRKSR